MEIRGSYKWRSKLDGDGGQHNLRTSDQARDRFLHEAGFEVLHVWNNELLNDPAGTCEAILALLRARAAPTLPSPASGGGE